MSERVRGERVQELEESATTPVPSSDQETVPVGEDPAILAAHVAVAPRRTVLELHSMMMLGKDTLGIIPSGGPALILAHPTWNWLVPSAKKNPAGKG